jgi:hypothetical protein
MLVPLYRLDLNFDGDDFDGFYESEQVSVIINQYLKLIMDCGKRTGGVLRV